mmetsp:Transcript_5225/g.13160  ORF Transcript_5225/g.13160 Transcript_5225/m.13160 type:complete len:214 (-) Transcript_5225:14-655(-)
MSRSPPHRRPPPHQSHPWLPFWVASQLVWACWGRGSLPRPRPLMMYPPQSRLFGLWLSLDPPPTLDRSGPQPRRTPGFAQAETCWPSQGCHRPARTHPQTRTPRHPPACHRAPCPQHRPSPPRDRTPSRPRTPRSPHRGACCGSSPLPTSRQASCTTGHLTVPPLSDESRVARITGARGHDWLPSLQAGCCPDGLSSIAERPPSPSQRFSSKF